MKEKLIQKFEEVNEEYMRVLKIIDEGSSQKCWEEKLIKLRGKIEVLEELINENEE